MTPGVPAAAVHEVELKLGIAAAALPDVLAHAAVVAAKRGPAHTSKLVSVYFDTPDARLARHGVALRIRRDRARWRQTVKGPASESSGGGLASRVEYEWPLARRSGPLRPDLRRLAGTPFGALVGEGAARLVPVFTTTFERTTLPLVLPDGTRAELAVDRGEVRGGARDAPSAPSEPISEVEIELREGRPAALFALALAIADDIPVVVQSRSKAERGYALAGRLVPAPLRAERPEHAPSATAGEAIATLLRSALRQIEANAAGIATGADPEWVHQMRVGVRRLRAVLAQARKLLPRGEARRLNGALRALAQSLAPVRDLDVFLGETLPSIEAVRRASVGETRALARLREAAVARRDAAHAVAAETVASPAVQRTLLEVAALAASAVRDADAKAARRLAAPAKAFAADVLSRRHRRLVARAADPEQLTADERHALRIAAKKLRYAADGFATLFPARRTKAYRDALATLQDVLGTMNDDLVAATLAASLDAPHSAAVRIVTRWDASRRAQQQADLAQAWRAFRRARRFWMDE